jgi:type II restriction enzyme
MVFLAVGDVKKIADFKKTKSIQSGRSMKTREIIKFVNQNFKENISSGSYDDIRRKDLRLLVLGSLVEHTNPNSARNDSTRGYAFNDTLAKLLQGVGQQDWDAKLKKFKKDFGTVKEKLAGKREIEHVPVILPSGQKLGFSPGGHNILQKEIIENFLPRFGYGAEVLYVGDTADKFLFISKEKLKALKFFEISHGELPDVLAYSTKKNWLYLIEAVYSSGPISPVRMIELKKLTKNCSAELVFITAFLDRATFRRFSSDIAWESEVWVADNPDHLIHFNGSRFFGPYGK